MNLKAFLETAQPATYPLKRDRAFWYRQWGDGHSRSVLLGCEVRPELTDRSLATWLIDTLFRFIP